MRFVTNRCRVDAMSQTDARQTLVGYLQIARDAVLWKLDGLSEYDVRRPMTPTGTSLLGLVKGYDWAAHHPRVEAAARLAGNRSPPSLDQNKNVF
ncbi:MAG: sle [Nocardioides sp.]|jgi:hypothetical protein|nr:sle [Nocardioides sp.]